jgi:hypothetical protein
LLCSRAAQRKLQTGTDFEVCGEAGDGREAVRIAQLSNPDLVYSRPLDACHERSRCCSAAQAAIDGASLFAGGHVAREVGESGDQSFASANAQGIGRESTGSKHYLLERAIYVNVGVQRVTALVGGCDDQIGIADPLQCGL